MYLFYEKESETRGKVMLMYNVTPPSELLAQPHIVLDIMPEPDVVAGKIGLPYVNPQTGEFFYEYIDNSAVTDGERIAVLETENLQLETKLTEMQLAIAELAEIIAGGAV